MFNQDVVNVLSSLANDAFYSMRIHPEHRSKHESITILWKKLSEHQELWKDQQELLLRAFKGFLNKNSSVFADIKKQGVKKNALLDNVVTGRWFGTLSQIIGERWPELWSNPALGWSEEDQASFKSKWEAYRLILEVEHHAVLRKVEPGLKKRL